MAREFKLHNPDDPDNVTPEGADQNYKLHEFLSGIEWDCRDDGPVGIAIWPKGLDEDHLLVAVGDTIVIEDDGTVNTRCVGASDATT